MADVFRAAQGVTIWLGPEDQFTDDALKAVEAISPLMALTSPNAGLKARQAWEDIRYTDFFDDSWYSRITEATRLQGRITHHQWLGLLALLSRPWFRRAWVVQELALARRASIVCGDRMVHWTRLAATLTFIYAKRWYHHLSTNKMRRIASLRDSSGVYSEFLASKTEFPTCAFSLMRTRKILRDRARSHSIGLRSRFDHSDQSVATCSEPLSPKEKGSGDALGKPAPKATLLDRRNTLSSRTGSRTGRRLEESPRSCGELFVDYILNLQIRHTLAPFSDVDFMPHQSHTHADNIQPRWQDLLRSEPEGLVVYKERMTTVMENIFQGTYSPMDQAELQHEFDIGSGSSRRLFRTDNDLLGTGLKSIRKGDEVWILAGSKLPMLLRKRSVSGHDHEFCLVGETYVHGTMHREDGERNLPGLHDVAPK